MLLIDVGHTHGFLEGTKSLDFVRSSRAPRTVAAFEMSSESVATSLSSRGPFRGAPIESIERPCLSRANAEAKAQAPRQITVRRGGGFDTQLA
jgi:hypothetical protein